MAKLSDFRNYHYEATVKVSDNARTLALSAIAIVWLLNQKNGGVYQVPKELLLPLLLVILSLALDFVQYVYRSIAWHIIFRKKESELVEKTITEDTEMYVSSWINFPAYILFYGKVLVLLFAYYYLLIFFLEKIQWT